MRIFNSRTKRQDEERMRQRQERARARQVRVDTIAGLHAAAVWLQDHPNVFPEAHRTEIAVPLPTANAVREFAEQRGLHMDEMPGLVSCQIAFGPVVIDVYAWAYDGTSRLRAAATGEDAVS